VASPDLAPAHWRTAQNNENTRQNADIPVSFQGNSPNAAFIFKSNTIAPSPPPNMSALSNNTSTLSSIDTSSRLHPSSETPDRSSPLSAGLRIHTDIIPGYTITAASANNTGQSSVEFSRLPPKSMGIARTPSIKNVLSSSIGSNSNLASAPSSALSSPMLNAMADVTPLPSPLLSGDSPGPWKKLVSRPTSRDLTIPVTTADSVLVTANGESISSAIANQSKRRAYHGLPNESGLTSSVINKEKNAEGHRRNRSISDYTPDAVQIPKVRNITVSGSHTPMVDATPDSATSLDVHMRREPNLAVQRGLAPIPR
jgi:protein-serine/threonine kinase